MSTDLSYDRAAKGPGLPYFRRIPQWLLLVGFWSILGLMTATLSHSRMVAVEQPTVYLRWLAESLLIWNFWSVASPFIFKLGSRAYADRSHRIKGAIILLAVGLLVTVAYTMYQIAVSMWVMGESFAQYRNTVMAQLTWFGPYSLLIFGGVVALGYAQAYRKRWEENEQAVRALENQLAQAQLDVLKAQLQPHFFFNTLNSISVLIRKGDTNSAQAMLTRLSELLRYTLAIGKRQTVPLSDEIEFVRGYLEIEKARFGERLKFELEAAPETLVLPIPPLTIQPIVENAVRHGISERDSGGTVSIHAGREGDLLVVSISDDGVGFEESKCKKGGSGLGIGHTSARLEQIYGDRSTLCIESQEGKGTVVTIKIPVSNAPEVRK